jgi:hypothetical protein
MKYYFFNYQTLVMVVAIEKNMRFSLTDEEIATLESVGRLEIGYGVWMKAVETV